MILYTYNYYYAETRNLWQKSYESAYFPSQSPTPIKKGEIHMYMYNKLNTHSVYISKVPSYIPSPNQQK